MNARGLALVLPVLLLLPTSFAMSAAEPTPDLGAQIAALATYRFGQDRAPLQAVEDAIRATQTAAGRRAIERHVARLLPGDATWEAKQWACRQLWFLGTDASVPALANLLSDERLVEMSCYALGRIPTPAAGKALRDALDQARGAGGITLINTIADRRDAAATAALERLAAEPDASTAQAAIRGLGQIGDDGAIVALSKLRSAASPERSAWISDAQLRCAGALAEAGRKPAAARIYQELLAANQHANIRRAALVGLAAADPNQALPEAVKWLANSDPVLQTAARAAIRRASPGPAAVALTPLLKGQPTAVTLDAIDLLAGMRDPSAAPAVTPLVLDEQAPVRLAAIVALGNLGNSASAATLLRAAMQSPTPAERQAAFASLTTLPGPTVDDLLLQQLPSAPAEARPGLIAVIADRGQPAALPALTQEALAGELATRRAAIRALARIGGPPQTGDLIQALIALKAEPLRDDLEQAIITLARKVEAPSRQPEPLIAALRTKPDQPARCSLLRILGSLGGAPALAVLTEALQDPDPAVQDVAFREVANWPSPAALDLLRTLFLEATQPTRRVLALRGYARLLAQDTERPSARKVEDYRALLEATRTPDERKLILAGLAEVPEPGALDLAVRCLADEAVGTEATLAVTRLAGALAGARPEAARQALEKAAAATAETNAKNQAKTLLLQMDAQVSWLTGWQVTGPYTQDGQDYAALFDHVFPPEQPGAIDVKWRDLPPGPDPARPFQLDLLKAIGGDQRVAYVRTFITSPKAQPALLELGTDDGVKVWLNGRVVHANNTARPLALDSDKVNVQLSEGVNVLLLKITQNNLGWEFAARLRQPDGRRIEGLRHQRAP